ncbi:MAG TPA: molybdopterin cofactor-binding domain-containing protein [Terriglobia bacterium]|nr:molybdopterin cofactor-binding domain-containing protein [Terriglobia bacterium]
MRTSRRAFLKSSARGGAGLALAVHLPELAAPISAPGAPVEFAPNAYIRIGPDNVVRLWVTRSEMGQGVRTTLPMMLVEELEADLKQVRLEQAMPGAGFKGIRLRTSGSGSSVGTYTALRLAGATAREMLISAACERWRVERSACRAEQGAVVHAASGRKIDYGELAVQASRQPVPQNPPLKNPNSFQVIGKPQRRLDGHAIVTGGATYGADVRLPGMLCAVMSRCPYLGGKLASFDAGPALKVAGVRKVVSVKSGIATGVAVVADSTWAALQGRDALRVEWDPGPNRDFDSDAFLVRMEGALNEPGYYVRGDGDAPKAIGSAARTIEATYAYPFQAHAPLETMNCTADARSDSCEIWAPTQCPETAHQDTAKALGLPGESVKLHVTLLGGGFGRRLFADYVSEAVEISRAVGKPVQLFWPRTDDMRYGFFQPPSVDHLQAGFDA